MINKKERQSIEYDKFENMIRHEDLFMVIDKLLYYEAVISFNIIQENIRFLDRFFSQEAQSSINISEIILSLREQSLDYQCISDTIIKWIDSIRTELK